MYALVNTILNQRNSTIVTAMPDQCQTTLDLERYDAAFITLSKRDRGQNESNHNKETDQNEGTEEMNDTTQSLAKKLDKKNNALAFLGEFVGTILFMLFALWSTNVANIPATTVTGSTTSVSMSSAAVTVLNTSSSLYIALSFGFSLAVCARIFFCVLGGLFNPTISLGLAFGGVITWFRTILLTIAQCLDAIVGPALVLAILPGNLYATTWLGSGTTKPQGLFPEAMCTFLLMLTVLFLAAEKNKALFLAPIEIGLALFVAELIGVLYTGGALNPAWALGPDVVLRRFPNYYRIYWVGPVLGAVVACLFYKAIKLMHFETVVPDQAGDGQ